LDWQINMTMQINNLAIIIPAYKPDFLNQALESIVHQTCKRFTLYIGNDASPFNLEPIVNLYVDRLNIVYKTFSANMGGKDLVGQWNRCIEMTQDEEWLWLFSDDDIMSENCVESFYSTIERDQSVALLHINIDIINEVGDVSHQCKPFSENMHGVNIFSEKIKLKLSSTIVEYIFKRSLFESRNGFERFDLAWGSDDATWIKFAGLDPIKTIPFAKVYWRLSTKNISASVTDSSIVTRKVLANVEYLHWAKMFFKQNRIQDPTNSFEKLKWILQTVKQSPLRLIEKIRLNNIVSENAQFGFLTSLLGAMYLGLSELKFFFKNYK